MIMLLIKVIITHFLSFPNSFDLFLVIFLSNYFVKINSIAISNMINKAVI